MGHGTRAVRDKTQPPQRRPIPVGPQGGPRTHGDPRPPRGIGAHGTPGAVGTEPSGSQESGGRTPRTRGSVGRSPSAQWLFFIPGFGGPWGHGHGALLGPYSGPWGTDRRSPWDLEVFRCGIPLTPTTSSVMQFGHLHTTQVYSTNTQEHIFLTSILAISQASCPYTH